MNCDFNPFCKWYIVCCVLASYCIKCQTDSQSKWVIQHLFQQFINMIYFLLKLSTLMSKFKRFYLRLILNLYHFWYCLFFYLYAYCWSLATSSISDCNYPLSFTYFTQPSFVSLFFSNDICNMWVIWNLLLSVKCVLQCVWKLPLHLHHFKSYSVWWGNVHCYGCVGQTKF
jgi:hypothetical protein